MPTSINKVIFFLWKGSLRQGIVGKDRKDRKEEGRALTAGTDLDKYTHPHTLASGNASGVWKESNSHLQEKSLCSEHAKKRYDGGWWHFSIQDFTLVTMLDKCTYYLVGHSLYNNSAHLKSTGFTNNPSGWPREVQRVYVGCTGD